MLLKIAQHGGKFKFQNAISFEWMGIFETFFTIDILVVSSFRYTIILKKTRYKIAPICNGNYGGHAYHLHKMQEVKLWLLM